MTHPNTPDSPSFSRILNLKLALLAVSFTLAGVLLLVLSGWLSTVELGSWGWLRLPVDGIGGTLLTSGLVGMILEKTLRRDQEAATLAQFRRIIREQAPALP